MFDVIDVVEERILGEAPASASFSEVLDTVVVLEVVGSWLVELVVDDGVADVKESDVTPSLSSLVLDKLVVLESV